MPSNDILQCVGSSDDTQESSQNGPARDHTRNGTAKTIYSRTQGPIEAIVQVRGGNCDVLMRDCGRRDTVDADPYRAAEGC